MLGSLVSGSLTWPGAPGANVLLAASICVPRALGDCQFTVRYSQAAGAWRGSPATPSTKRRLPRRSGRRRVGGRGGREVVALRRCAAAPRASPPSLPFVKLLPLPLASHRLAVGVLPPHSWSSLFWHLHLWNFFPSTFEHLKFYSSFPAGSRYFVAHSSYCRAPPNTPPRGYRRVYESYRTMFWILTSRDFARYVAISRHSDSSAGAGPLGCPWLLAPGPGCHPATLQSRANLPLPVLERTQGSGGGTMAMAHGSLAGFNTNDGYLEAMLRGFRFDFLTPDDYQSMTQQVETLEGDSAPPCPARPLAVAAHVPARALPPPPRKAGFLPPDPPAPLRHAPAHLPPRAASPAETVRQREDNTPLVHTNTLQQTQHRRDAARRAPATSRRTRRRSRVRDGPWRPWRRVSDSVLPSSDICQLK